MVIGAPGKVTRQLGAEQIARLRASADSYVEKAQRYISNLAAQRQADALE